MVFIEKKINIGEMINCIVDVNIKTIFCVIIDISIKTKSRIITEFKKNESKKKSHVIISCKTYLKNILFNIHVYRNRMYVCKIGFSNSIF